MTNKEFFNKVKGKKITNEWWKSEKDYIEYFVPENLITDNIMSGTNYYTDGRFTRGDVWYFFDGGKFNERYLWTILDETVADDRKERKCNCSSRDLFNFGCKCGGI